MAFKYTMKLNLMANIKSKIKPKQKWKKKQIQRVEILHSSKWNASWRDIIWRKMNEKQKQNEIKFEITGKQ